MEMSLRETELVTRFEELIEKAAIELSSEEFKQFFDDISIILADYGYGTDSLNRKF